MTVRSLLFVLSACLWPVTGLAVSPVTTHANLEADLLCHVALRPEAIVHFLRLQGFHAADLSVLPKWQRLRLNVGGYTAKHASISVDGPDGEYRGSKFYGLAMWIPAPERRDSDSEDRLLDFFRSEMHCEIRQLERFPTSRYEYGGSEEVFPGIKTDVDDAIVEDLGGGRATSP